MYLFPDNVKENVQKANIGSTTARRWKFYYSFLNNGPDETKNNNSKMTLSFFGSKSLAFWNKAQNERLLCSICNREVRDTQAALSFAHLHIQERHPGFPLLCRQRPLAPLWPWLWCVGTWVCRWRTVCGTVGGTTPERHLSQASSPLSFEIHSLSECT